MPGGPVPVSRYPGGPHGDLQAAAGLVEGAAYYHLLPIAASVNKINWAGPAVLQQLFARPFQASLRCWEHIQSPHSIFFQAVSLQFSVALQIATCPGQDLGR